jgi:hypothetical protein
MAGSAFASLIPGIMIGRGDDGTRLNFSAVGWLAATCTLVCIVLARDIRVVPDAALRSAE